MKGLKEGSRVVRGYVPNVTNNSIIEKSLFEDVKDEAREAAISKRQEKVVSRRDTKLGMRKS